MSPNGSFRQIPNCSAQLVGRKALTIGASDRKEPVMELITQFEVASMPLFELHALRGRVHAHVLRTVACALSALENIDREIVLRSGPTP